MTAAVSDDVGPEVSGCPPPLGVAARAVVRRGSEILLLKRSNSVGYDPGLWELPGGKMDFGEVLTEALEREVAEETGLAARILTPLVTWHFVKEPFWVTGVTFICESGGGDIVLSAEHSDYRWVTPEEALGLPLSSTISEQLKVLVEWERTR